MRLYLLGLIAGAVAALEGGGPLAGAPELDLQGGHTTKYGSAKYMWAPKLRDASTARAYNISDPIYTCPKPGYVLHGEECVFEDTVPARYECPIGYEQTPPGVPGFDTNCTRTVPPVLSCSQGSLRQGVCVISDYHDVSLACPPDTIQEPDGSCMRFQPVDVIEMCPDGSTRVGDQCLVVEYHEPSFVCPPGSYQEGKKCRREVMYFKDKMKDKDHKEYKDGYKGKLRRLSAVEEQLEGAGAGNYLEAEVLLDELDDEGGQYFEEQDQDQNLQGKKPKAGYYYGGGQAPWLPATYAGSYPAAPVQRVDKYQEALKWQKINVQVPVVVSKKEKDKVKVQKMKPPQQVVKVISQAAERICPLSAQRLGNSCVVQKVVPPVTECPVQTIRGACGKRFVLAPIASCPVGTMICPPNIPGPACRCETTTTAPPFPVCNFGTMIDGQCVSYARPREYCPLGYFLDRATRNCIRRDIEPALCLFSVTYVCPDCDVHEPHAPPHPHQPPLQIPGPALVGKKGGVKYGKKGAYWTLGDEDADDADEGQPPYQLMGNDEEALNAADFGDFEFEAEN